MTHTHQTVHDLIQSQWESDFPDRILQALRASEGKAITTRLLQKLPPLPDGETYHLIRHYGWTSLETSTYRDGSYRSFTACSLMLARSEASVPLDTAWVKTNNAAYFEARDQRNHARMEAMNTKSILDAIATAMNKAEAAIVAIREAQYEVDTLCEYGRELHPDHYAIEKACGLDDEDGRPLINREYKKRAAPAQEMALG